MNGVRVAATLAIGAAVAIGTAIAMAPPELRNWFDDPFFTVRAALRDCPTPLGPLTTGEEMQTQTHARSERGTRCYLEGRCNRPNSYAYDADIAAAVRARFATSRRFRDASLWVTVQRRIVWIEGCVAPTYRSGALERLIRDVPDIELVVVNVRRGRDRPIPYRRLDGRPLG